jgi:nitrilase
MKLNPPNRPESRKTPFKVAALQMVSGEDLEANLATAAQLIEQAVNEGAELIVLPESFSLYGSVDYGKAGKREISHEGPARHFLAEQAARHGVWLVGGTIPVLDKKDSKGRVRAACFVYNDKGVEQARYDKIHLFDVELPDKQKRYAESDVFSPGSEVVCVDTPFGLLGLAVCYDLRFPELFRVLFQRRVDLVAVPSAFTDITGEAHWLALLRARAIENCCYMIGANQGGEHDSKRITWGGSAVVNPWGDCLAEAAKGNAVVVAEVDPGKREELLGRIPVHRHQRIWIKGVGDN